jgi:formiminoglutamase
LKKNFTILVLIDFKRCQMRTSTPPELFFRGRDGDPRLGEHTFGILEGALLPEALTLRDVVILGSPDDTGVTRNLGRPGAALGPNEIRKHFYRFAWPFAAQTKPVPRIFDFGNTIVNSNIAATHADARENAANGAASHACLVTLGGGHDFAASHLLGWMEGRDLCLSNKRTKEKVSKALKAGTDKNPIFGIINIDPHLDVRPLPNDHLPHSGTPFRQILESKFISGSNLIEFGARVGRNASRHFDYCEANNVKVITLDSLLAPESRLSVVQHFSRSLSALSRRVNEIAITIDMDSCSDIWGVSAATALGFSSRELYQMVVLAGRNNKVTCLDICETAPPLDTTERTAKLAAELMFAFLIARSR